MKADALSVKCVWSPYLLRLVAPDQSVYDAMNWIPFRPMQCDGHKAH
jgi:hypothetical protein